MLKRTYSVDILKAICAFLIVTIHVQWNFRPEMLPLARCAVPCFFVISGFFLYKDGGIGSVRLKRAIKHIAIITFWSTLLFIFRTEILSVQDGEIYIPTVKTLLVWLCLNDCPFGLQLWYLYAYLYVLIMIVVVDRYHKWTLLFVAAPLLLLPNVAYYFLLHSGVILPDVLLRNFLFTGLPFFAIGAMVKSAKYGYWLRRFGKLWWVIFFAVLSCIEGSITHDGPEICLYISTPFLSISLFCMFLSIRVKGSNWLSKIGERDSLYIYLFHLIFIVPAYRMTSLLGIGKIMAWISPLIVYVLTLAVVILCRNIFSIAKNSFKLPR